MSSENNSSSSSNVSLFDRLAAKYKPTTPGQKRTIVEILEDDEHQVNNASTTPTVATTKKNSSNTNSQTPKNVNVATITPTAPQQAPVTPKPQKKQKPLPKNQQPHVLIWVCTHGKGQSSTWTKKALDIIGVYATKADAEAKRDQLLNEYPNCGYGDIQVGGCWDDEINLVIRPAGEFNVFSS